ARARTVVLCRNLRPPARPDGPAEDHRKHSPGGMKKAHGRSPSCLSSEDFALVANSAGDAFAVEKFEQGDGVLARQAAGDLFKDRYVDLRTHSLARLHARFQFINGFAMKDEVADAHDALLGGK